MAAIETIQIIILLVGCIYASITDLKNGKISNRLITGMISVAIISDAIMYGYFYREGLLTFFTNIAMIISVSIFLYATHVWAGGDCKLLIAVALLFPESRYWIVNDTQITLWIALMFIFISGFIFLVCETIILLIKEKPRFELKQMGKQLLSGFIRYIKAVIYLAAINHLYYYFINPKIEIPTAVYVCICIAIVWGINTCEITNSKMLLGAVLVFDCLMTLFTGMFTVSLAWETYILIIIFMVLRLFIEKYNYQTISVDELKPGMILSRNSSVWMQQSRVKGLPAISDETLKSRLKNDEVDSILRWKSSKSGLGSVVIVRKIPFAIFITIGVLVYFGIGSVL